MIHLLDINVLIALFDQDSDFHESAKRFLATSGSEGWATCPLTENGFLRIVGGIAYSHSVGNPTEALRILRAWRTLPGHQFWPDDLSLCNSDLFPNLPGSKHLTDAYLLGLAAARGGQLATFDRRIDSSSVRGGDQALRILVP